MSHDLPRGLVRHRHATVPLLSRTSRSEEAVRAEQTDGLVGDLEEVARVGDVPTESTSAGSI
jgi:hypothetical protein